MSLINNCPLIEIFTLIYLIKYQIVMRQRFSDVLFMTRVLSDVG
jgi:hypothetical protein